MLARWIPLGSQQPAGLGTAKKLEKRCKGPCFSDNPRRGEVSSARMSNCAVSDLFRHQSHSTNGVLMAFLLLYAHGAKLSVAGLIRQLHAGSDIPLLSPCRSDSVAQTLCVGSTTTTAAAKNHVGGTNAPVFAMIRPKQHAVRVAKLEIFKLASGRPKSIKLYDWLYMSRQTRDKHSLEGRFLPLSPG